MGAGSRKIDEDRLQRQKAEEKAVRQKERELQKEKKSEAKKLREQKRLECMKICKASMPANSTKKRAPSPAVPKAHEGTSPKCVNSSSFPINVAASALLGLSGAGEITK